MRVREGKGSLVCLVPLVWLTGGMGMMLELLLPVSLSPFLIPDASCGIDQPSRPRLHGNLIAGRREGQLIGSRGEDPSLSFSLSDPSIRFEKKVCQVHEGFAGIKAGPRKRGRTSARTDRSWAYFCCAGPIEIRLRVDNAKSR